MGVSRQDRKLQGRKAFVDSDERSFPADRREHTTAAQLEMTTRNGLLSDLRSCMQAPKPTARVRTMRRGRHRRAHPDARPSLGNLCPLFLRGSCFESRQGKVNPSISDPPGQSEKPRAEFFRILRSRFEALLDQEPFLTEMPHESQRKSVKQFDIGVFWRYGQTGRGTTAKGTRGPGESRMAHGGSGQRATSNKGRTHPADGRKPWADRSGTVHPQTEAF